MDNCFLRKRYLKTEVDTVHKQLNLFVSCICNIGSRLKESYKPIHHSGQVDYYIGTCSLTCIWKSFQFPYSIFNLKYTTRIIQENLDIEAYLYIRFAIPGITDSSANNNMKLKVYKTSLSVSFLLSKKKHTNVMAWSIPWPKTVKMKEKSYYRLK